MGAEIHLIRDIFYEESEEKVVTRNSIELGHQTEIENFYIEKCDHKALESDTEIFRSKIKSQYREDIIIGIEKKSVLKTS